MNSIKITNFNSKPLKRKTILKVTSNYNQYNKNKVYGCFITMIYLKKTCSCYLVKLSFVHIISLFSSQALKEKEE